MRLADLQAKFQDAILTGDRTILASVEPSQKLDSAARFGVYADAYLLRLAEFLSNDYPVLRNALGDEDFGALVEAYITATPSHHRNARWYGHGLPEFMRKTDPWCDSRVAVDFALFERALADAFDAADADVLDLDAVGAVAPEDWPELRFEFHPSAVLLTLVAGTIAAYAAVDQAAYSDEEAGAAEEDVETSPAGVETDAASAEPALVGQEATSQETSNEETKNEETFGQETLGQETLGEEASSEDAPSEEMILVWRNQSQSFYRTLGEDETLAFNEAAIDLSFGEICSLLAFRNGGEDVSALAATFLATWFRDGLITSLRR
jgi:hypothetical protein